MWHGIHGLCKYVVPLLMPIFFIKFTYVYGKEDVSLGLHGKLLLFSTPHFRAVDLLTDFLRQVALIGQLTTDTEVSHCSDLDG